MVRRDVDLVIRARNEASSAINQITAALKDFAGTQQEIQAGAAGTKTSLAQLGTSLTKLNAAFGGSATKRVASELGKAREEIERVGGSLKKAAGEAIGYTREAKAAATVTQKFRTEATQVAAAIKAQVQALRESKAAQTATNAEIKKASAARSRLIAEDKKLNAGIEEQGLKLALARGKLRQLQDQLDATTQPSARLAQSFQSTSVAVEKASAKLEELRTTQAVVRAAIDQTGTALARSNEKLQAQAGLNDRQTASLAKLKGQQKDLTEQIKASAGAQGKLESSSRRAVSALEREDAALEGTAAELQEMEAAAQGTAGALAQVANVVRGNLLRAFGQQRQAVQQAQAQWDAAQATVRQLAIEMRSVEAPSEQLVAAFLDAKLAAGGAKAEFQANQTILQGMRTVLRETGGDVDAMAGQLLKLEGIMEKGNRSLSDRKKKLAELNSVERRAAGAANQAAGGAERLAGATRGLGAAQGAATRKTLTFAAALRKFYGNSRTALSFTQRLRSEVLALILAYGGLFAAFQGVRSVVDAFQQLEAAQNRLNVVFEGDQAAIGQELQFIRGEARRLGIEFGTLAQEYTKFAVATKGTNLAGKETRRIFTAVAEAGRVNKLSLDQLKGVFVALSQIVSKGSVQMEELRQQLGDRLPGALQILAAGLKVSTKDLIKMIETGKVSSDALSAFADELTNRFSGALPAALKSTTAEIGRFQNALFEALLIVGKSQFIEQFTQFLRDFTDELQSADAIAFLQRMGVVLAEITQFLGLLVQNFDLVVIAITAFVSSRLAPFLIVLIGRFVTLNTTSVSTRRILAAMSADMGRVTTIAGKSAVAIRGLGLAFKGLLSATGIGLAITVIGGLIGGWAASADSASEAMAAHREVVDKVKQAYFEAEGNVGLFVEAVREITSGVEAAKSLEDLVEAAEDARDAFEGLLLFGTRSRVGALREPFEGLVDQLDSFDKGLFSTSQKFLDAVDVILQGADALDADAKVKVFNLAKAYAAAADAAAAQADVVKARQGDMDAAARLVGDATADTSAHEKALRLAAERAKQYATAMQTLQSSLPGVSDELERVQKAASLVAAFQSALKHAKSMGQVEAAWRKWQEVLQQIKSEEALTLFEGKTGSGLEQSIRLLKQLEGFEPTGKLDVNAFRAGFGSDEITLKDGTIKKITEGMAVTMEDALRDLQRRITEFQDVIKGQIGEGRFASFDPQQQAALTSIAYNYGQLPARMVEAVQTGTKKEIAQAIRDLSIGEERPNVARRDLEADLFAGGDIDISRAVAVEDERLKLAEKLREEREAEAQATKDTIADGEFQVAQQQLIIAGREREAAIAEAVRQARDANANITRDEIEAIEELTGKVFDLEHAGDALEAQRKRAAEAEREVNDLLTVRNQLTEQLNLLRETGADNDAINRTEAGIEQINEQLLLAIDRTLALYEALGGSGADAAIAKLNTMKMTIEDTGERALLNFTKVKDLFATGFVNAVDKFSQAVANGEKATKALGDAFRAFAADFLRQIAQMIIKQIILNLLKAAGGGLGFPVGHTGGMVGTLGNRKRNIDPAAFMGAMRFHTGGIAGLGPNEVPLIADKTEELLTDSDPRHRNNLGQNGGAAAPAGNRIINAVDGSSFLEEALAAPEGEELMLNYIRANSSAVRSVLGV